MGSPLNGQQPAPAGKPRQQPAPAGDRFQLARQGNNFPQQMAPVQPSLQGGGAPSPYMGPQWAGGTQFNQNAKPSKGQAGPAPQWPPQMRPPTDGIGQPPGAAPPPGAPPAAPGGVNHQANFDQLMKEDPFAARYYAENYAPDWYRQNQIQIAKQHFGATDDWVNGGNGVAGWQPMNQWINDNSAGGGTWSTRGGNALDVVNPQLHQRLRAMAGLR